MPVLATGWGGHRDYLGDDAQWPGAMRFRMTRVPVFPPDAPSYWGSQRWATVDDDVAVALAASSPDQGEASGDPPRSHSVDNHRTAATGVHSQQLEGRVVERASKDAAVERQAALARDVGV